jgi:hypothetical protein
MNAETQTTSSSTRHLTSIPRNAGTQETIPASVQMADTNLPLPFDNLDGSVSARARRAASLLLREVIDEKSGEINSTIKKLKHRVAQLNKARNEGIRAMDDQNEARLLSEIMAPKVKLITQIDQLLQTSPTPSAKELARVLFENGDTRSNRKTISDACRLLGAFEISTEVCSETRYLDTKESLLSQHQDSWIGPILTDFATYLERHQLLYEKRGYIGEHSRYSSKTKADTLCRAARLMEFLKARGLIDIRQMRQHHLDEFYLHYPGSASTVAKFVKYLSKRSYFTFKFQLSNKKFKIDLSTLVLGREIEQLTHQMLDEELYIQEAILVLFAMYYVSQSIIQHQEWQRNS